MHFFFYYEKRLPKWAILSLGNLIIFPTNKESSKHWTAKHRFDTSAPPLSEEELRAYGQSNNYQDAQDIYDFNTLRHELGGEEPVDDDNLADHLVEQGDDRNDVTFDDGPVGNDFDFSGNTQRISSNAISEEEAFYAKRKQQQQQGASGKKEK